MISFYFMCMFGGFFGMFAILKIGVVSSALTSNYLHLFQGLCSLDSRIISIYGIAAFLYILALCSGYLIFKKNKTLCQIFSILIGTSISIAYCFFPAVPESTVYFYPLIFTTAFQWTAFGDVCGFKSASIFSTNNTRQVIFGLIDKDKKRVLCFAGSLVSFHFGAVFCYFMTKLFAQFATLFAIIFTASALISLFKERKQQ